MQGESNLEAMIANMNAQLNEGEYVFVTVQNADLIPRDLCICEMKEQEGTTLVISKETAIAHGLAFDFVAAWLTLQVHSSLSAVGLTAAFATELTKHGISANVIAGFYHDHIFVDSKDGIRALNTLQDMANKISIQKSTL